MATDTFDFLGIKVEAIYTCEGGRAVALENPLFRNKKYKSGYIDYENMQAAFSEKMEWTDLSSVIQANKFDEELEEEEEGEEKIENDAQYFAMRVDFH